MAKLSADGRTEIYRIEKSGAKFFALMSDNWVLYNYGTGWKRSHKLSTNQTPSQWIEAMKRNGWNTVSR